MAAYCYKNAYLSVGGTDVSAYVMGCTPNMELDKVEFGTMGKDAKSRIAGIDDWSIEVEFRQDFAAGLLDAILAPWRGVEKAIIFKPNGASTSTSNPKWTGNGIFFGYAPVDGSHGELATTKITIECSDGVPLARATAD